MAYYDKDGPIMGKKCKECGSRFPRFGVTGAVPGILLCFLLFGGTSKYCPQCREAREERGEKNDKGFLFRLAWFAVVVLILAIICFAA